MGKANQLRGVFSAAMEELDGDDVRVSSRGRYAERDIVHVDRISWGQKKVVVSKGMVGRRG